MKFYGTGVKGLNFADMTKKIIAVVLRLWQCKIIQFGDHFASLDDIVEATNEKKKS